MEQAHRSLIPFLSAGKLELCIGKVADWLKGFGGWAEVEKCMKYDGAAITNDMPLFAVHENAAEYGAEYADISFNTLNRLVDCTRIGEFRSR